MSQPPILPVLGVPQAVPVRFFYIDDSGTVDTGWIVYSWVECSALTWNAGLRAWLDFRKQLFLKHAIPVSYELHATKFARGEGNPSADPLWNRHKRNRGPVVQDALATIGGCAHLNVGTVYRQTSASGSAYAQERGDLYQQLVHQLDRRLGAASEAGVLLMDGRPVSRYYDAHRSLPLATRNIIEDPLFVESGRSQWVQMADLVAWSAYQHLRAASPPTKRHFARHWYPTHLAGCDIHGGPQPL